MFYLLLALIPFARCELQDSDIDWDMLLRYDVKGKMIEHSITPIIIPIPPEDTCHVHFRWGEPKPGETVPDDEDKENPPTVTWIQNETLLYSMFSYCVLDWQNVKTAALAGLNYTINEWHEWAVYNIPRLFFFKGHTIYDYKPCPAPKNPKERNLIVYLVFQQKSKIRIPHISNVTWEEYQKRTRVLEFAKLYGLGDPIAGNFYYVRYDRKRGYYDLH